MAKMRGIKPEIWTDDKFVELTPLARLLFIGMWNYACDNGHVEERPTQLKLRILPADDCDVAQLLEEIVARGMAIRSPGLLTIPKLPQHQRIDKRYLTTCAHCEPAGDTAAAPRGHALKEGRKEGEKKEGEGEGSATGARAQKRAQQLPSSWLPNDGHHAFAAENRVDLDHEAEQFKDYHRSRGSAMKDWDAAFRTWLRNVVKWRKPEPANGVPRVLPPHASELTHPPDGLSPDELSRWYFEDAQRKKAAR